VSVLVYVGLMVLVNVSWVVLPMVQTPWGPWSWGSLLVGAVFVARDYAQRAVGQRVLIAMAAGLVLTYWAASPAIALVSAGAFAASELAEWATYTVTRRPFRDRVLLSVGIAVPLDTVIFLAGLHSLSWPQFGMQVVSKMVALTFIVLRTEGSAK
jgi:queuosine precursor transporter